MKQQLNRANEPPGAMNNYQEACMLRPGDHVVRLVRPAIRSQFKPNQQHGIVIKVAFNTMANDWMVTVSDLSQKHRRRHEAAPTNTHIVLPPCHDNKRHRIPAYRTLAREWTKVKYGSADIEKIFSHAGSSTMVLSDKRRHVLARVFMLLAAPSRIRRQGSSKQTSHATRYNSCECLAVWCKTGVWTTLQGATWARIMRSNNGFDTATAQAWAAFLVTASKYVFWQYLGRDVEASLVCGFPVVASASVIGGVAMNAVFLKWLGRAIKDWDKPASVEKSTEEPPVRPRRRNLMDLGREPEQIRRLV